MRYRCGNFMIVAPSGFVGTGEVVELHSHTYHHMTYFPLGEWECRQFDVLCSSDGQPKLGPDGRPELLLSSVINKGPGTWLEMPAECWHQFTCTRGPGMYHCLWPCRDPVTGEVVEYFTGWGLE